MCGVDHVIWLACCAPSHDASGGRLHLPRSIVKLNRDFTSCACLFRASPRLCCATPTTSVSFSLRGPLPPESASVRQAGPALCSGTQSVTETFSISTTRRTLTRSLRPIYCSSDLGTARLSVRQHVARQLCIRRRAHPKATPQGKHSRPVQRISH